MFYKKLLIKIYRIISKPYIFLFGRKKMQFLNNIIFSLTLDAKGYKNYGNLYETGEKSFVRLIKNDLNLSLDIGANVGKYTKMLLSETKSNVVSFEPLPDAFEELKKIKSEYKGRLDIFNIAIGNENKEQNIFFGDVKSEKASLVTDLKKLSFVGDINKNSKIIDVKKLDSFENFFSNKKIDFIKIDTEGYEFEVLDGAKNLLNKHKPKFIQLEFNWHQLLKNQTLYKLSSLIDFSDVFRILPHGKKLLEVDPSRPENNIFHLSNYVFIRKDISEKYK